MMVSVSLILVYIYICCDFTPAEAGYISSGSGWKNYCEEKISFRDGMPLTTKKDKHLHGFGMKSIQSTVRKYGGSVRAGLGDNWFEVSILIPLKEQKS